MNQINFWVLFSWLFILTNACQAMSPWEPDSEADKKALDALEYLDSKGFSISIMPKKMESKEGKTSFLPEIVCKHFMKCLSPRSQQALRDIEDGGYYASFKFKIPDTSE